VDKAQVDRIKEMNAYDALPQVVRDAFDAAPMKVSVYNTMRKPGFAAAYVQMNPTVFATLITKHFTDEAARNHQEDQLTTTQ
jgi:hypothetical protein